MSGGMCFKCNIFTGKMDSLVDGNVNVNVEC